MELCWEIGSGLRWLGNDLEIVSAWKRLAFAWVAMMKERGMENVSAWTSWAREKGTALVWTSWVRGMVIVLAWTSWVREKGTALARRKLAFEWAAILLEQKKEKGSALK